MDDKHTHDCTGPDMRCPCGFTFRVPRYAISFDVYDNDTKASIAGDVFMSDSLRSAVSAFEKAARTLDAKA